MGKGTRFPFSRFKDKHWLYYIDKINLCDNDEDKRLYLSILINEMYECHEEALNIPAEQDSVADIITYINSNLTNDISLDDICKIFYISKSHLNRKFKRMTGSTVWEYITAKRLILAKKLLGQGEPPMTAYTKCGFNDYTSFYRAYKSRFCVSPKNDYIRKQEKRESPLWG